MNVLNHSRNFANYDNNAIPRKKKQHQDILIYFSALCKTNFSMKEVSLVKKKITKMKIITKKGKGEPRMESIDTNLIGQLEN